MSKGLSSICGASAGVSLLALLALVSSSAAADAVDQEPLRVELVAPSTCPTSPDLLERVRRHTTRVRSAKLGEPARTLRVRVTAHTDARGEEKRFVADLQLVEANEALERQVPGRTCEEVLAAVALITAVTIDPLASMTPSDGGALAPETSEASVPDARAPRPSLDAGPSPGPSPREPPRLHATFGVSLEAQGLGELVLGRALWIEGTLAARLAPSVRLRAAQSQSFTVERALRPAYFQLSTAAVEGCVTLADGRIGQTMLELRPCAQAAGGILEASSSAFGPSLRTSRAWVALGGLVQARWRFLGPLALETTAGLTLPLVRDDFFFLPRIDVYRAPPVVLLGNVGVGTTFR